MSWTSFRSLSPKAMSMWRTGIPRDRGLRPFVHVLRSRRLQHLRGLIRHVLDKLPLVVPEGHVDVEDGDPPGVDLFLVQLDVVLEAWQALPEAPEVEGPAPLVAHPPLEGGPEPRDRMAVAPLLHFCPALEAVAAEEGWLRVGHVAEARDVDAVGTPRVLLRDRLQRRQHAPRPSPCHVVHEVVADHAAAVRDAVRVAGGARVQQDARGLQG